MSRYRIGADFERAVQDDLEDRGYLAFRVAGSKGAADIIAFPPRRHPKIFTVLLVQCKTNGVMGPAERTEFWKACESAGCIPVKASRPKRGAILYERYYPGNKTFGEVEL